MSQYIYLIREREFVKNKEDIYKIGKTTQEPSMRMQGYPKGSELILTVKVSDSSIMENKIKQKFITKYIQCKEVGVEYFKGSGMLMRNDIFEMIKDDKFEETETNPQVIEIYKDLLSISQNVKTMTPTESILVGPVMIDKLLASNTTSLNQLIYDYNKLQMDMSTWRSNTKWANGVLKYRNAVDKIEKQIKIVEQKMQYIRTEDDKLRAIKNKINMYTEHQNKEKNNEEKKDVVQ